MSSNLPHTIGDGWSQDPNERAQQIAAQERLVSQIADVYDDLCDDELEAYAEQQRGTCRLARRPRFSTSPRLTMTDLTAPLDGSNIAAPNMINFFTAQPDNTTEVLRLDSAGFHYKGQTIEDAGEAYRLFSDWMRHAQAAPPEFNLAQACRLSGVDYETYLKIRAYLPARQLEAQTSEEYASLA